MWQRNIPSSSLWADAIARIGQFKEEARRAVEGGDEEVACDCHVIS
jgi:hypothetical protein